MIYQGSAQVAAGDRRTWDSSSRYFTHCGRVNLILIYAAACECDSAPYLVEEKALQEGHLVMCATHWQAVGRCDRNERVIIHRCHRWYCLKCLLSGKPRQNLMKVAEPKRERN